MAVEAGEVPEGATQGSPGGPSSDGPVLLATMLRRATTVGIATHMTQVVDVLQARGVPAQIVRPNWPAPLPSTALVTPTTVLRRLTRGERAVLWDRAMYQRLLEQGLRRAFRAAGRPRLVYAQDPRSAAAALKVRGDARVPVVMVFHSNDSQAQELVDRGFIAAGGRSDRLIREFEAALFPRLDGMVFVSDYMRERMTEAVPALADVPSAVVPNFLEEEPVTAVSAASGTPSGDCITVGSLVDRKNHEYLLEVLAAARREGHTPSLTVVGHGPLRARLEARARALGVADQVLFTGSRSDVPALLRRHRVYVHSATMENLPYALIEAFRAGRPVVAGRVGGIGELVGNQEAGRFWPLDDPVAGARVLTSLLTDAPALERASRTATQIFEDRYSVSAAGAALADFLLLSAAR
jgi:glycosyltransferase involved in cell wall biosynthesis